MTWILAIIWYQLICQHSHPSKKRLCPLLMVNIKYYSHLGFFRFFKYVMAVAFILSLVSNRPLLLELLLILPREGGLCHDPLPLLKLSFDGIRWNELLAELSPLYMPGFRFGLFCVERGNVLEAENNEYRVIHHRRCAKNNKMCKKNTNYYMVHRLTCQHFHS